MISGTYTSVGFDLFVGNDVDKRSYSLAIRNHQRVIMTKKIPARPENLYNFIRHRFADQKVIVGYEAGPTGFGLYDYMNSRGQPCILIPTSSIPHAISERVKTNRIDAIKLSCMLKDGDFKPVRVPEGPYRDLRDLVRLRTNYVRGQQVAKQRIKSLLLYHSLAVSAPDAEMRWSNRTIASLKRLECSHATRLRLNMLLEDLAYNRERLLKTTKELRNYCKTTPEIKDHMRYILSVSGIGIVTASALLSRIGDPNNLRNLQEIGAFVGLAPAEYSTGDNVNKGSITRLGDRLLRSLLIEAAWRAIHYDKELEQFYNRIKSRHHQSVGSRKAIVAVARKLTLRIYRVLKDKREYIKR